MSEFKLVYQFTPGEAAQLSRLQAQVMQAIQLFMGAKNVEFNPRLHAVNFEDGTVVMQVDDQKEKVDE